MLESLGGPDDDRTPGDAPESAEEAPRRPARAEAPSSSFATRSAGAGRPAGSPAFAARLARWERALRSAPGDWTLKEILERLCETVVPDGAVAVVDGDGLVIAGCAADVLDEAVGVHLASAARSARRAARREGWGALRHLSMDTGDRRLLWVTVDDDLGLVLYGPREAARPQGRWRHAARLAAADLARRLA